MADDRTTAYAEALFAVARAEGPLAEIEDELFRVAQVLRGNDELRDTLADPHVPVTTRQQVVIDQRCRAFQIPLVAQRTAALMQQLEQLSRRAMGRRPWGSRRSHDRGVQGMARVFGGRGRGI